MKKLICEKDIEALAESGTLSCAVDHYTIVTPSARDTAAKLGVLLIFTDERKEPSADPEIGAGAITQELVFNVLQSLIRQERLSPDFCEKLLETQRPYVYSEDPSGARVIDGKTVRMDADQEGGCVRRQKLEFGRSLPFSVSLLEINHGGRQRTRERDEILYAVEGAFCLRIGERRYTVKTGDCVFLPKETCGELLAESRCKIFCCSV